MHQRIDPRTDARRYFHWDTSRCWSHWQRDAIRALIERRASGGIEVQNTRLVNLAQQSHAVRVPRTPTESPLQHALVVWLPGTPPPGTPPLDVERVAGTPLALEDAVRPGWTPSQRRDTRLEDYTTLELLQEVVRRTVSAEDTAERPAQRRRTGESCDDDEIRDAS